MKTKLFLLVFYVFVNFALVIDNFDIDWSSAPALYAWKSPFCFIANSPVIITGIHINLNGIYQPEMNASIFNASNSLYKINQYSFKVTQIENNNSGNGINFIIESSKKIPEKFSLALGCSNLIFPIKDVNSNVAKINRVGLKINGIQGKALADFATENYFREIIL